jgi:D-glycero-D-manno-heptose 1,7-bisphosphate phosphatase
VAVTAGATRAHPLVFLDKDGTLIENVPYNVDPEQVRLTRGADYGLRRLTGSGYRLVVVSNQAGVARDLFPEEALAGITRRLRSLLADLGVPLVDVLYCPHDPAGALERYRIACDCRKPAPGLLTRAAAALGADLTRSWMVGDVLDDVEAGHRAGCRTILIEPGGETEWRDGPDRRPDYLARDLAEAAETILSHDRLASAR